MKTVNSLVLILVASFAMTACDFKKSDPITLLDRPNPNPNQGQGNGQQPGDGTPNVRPEDQLITFAHLQKTSLLSCKDCHSKTSNPNKKPLLLTLEQFKARLDDVINETSSGDMPPADEGYKPLTACEKAMLEKWIELGTPETTTVKVYDLGACNPNPPSEPPVDQPPVVQPPEEPPPVEQPPVVEPPVVEPPVVEPPVVEPPVAEEQLVTFDYLLKTALVSCADCHTKTKNEKKKPLLTTLEQFHARIADVVTEVNNDDMPQTDEGAQLLTACEKAMLNKWVDAGAPESTTIKVSEIAECATTPVAKPVVNEQPALSSLFNISLTDNETEPKVEDAVLTFEILQKTSFVSCSECHSKTKNPKKKPLLVTVEDFQAVKDDVRNEVNNDDMPETKNGAVLLNSCEKAMMNLWIDAGATATTTIKLSEIPECKHN